MSTDEKNSALRRNKDCIEAARRCSKREMSRLLDIGSTVPRHIPPLPEAVSSRLAACSSAKKKKQLLIKQIQWFACARLSAFSGAAKNVEAVCQVLRDPTIPMITVDTLTVKKEPAFPFLF